MNGLKGIVKLGNYKVIHVLLGNSTAASLVQCRGEIETHEYHNPL